MKLTAKIISILTHPLLIGIGATIIISYIGLPGKPLINLLPLITTVAALFVFLRVALVIVGRAKQLEILELNRNERDSAYLVGLIGSMVAVVVYTTADFIDIKAIEISMLLAVFMGIMYFVNRYADKASLHASTFTICVFALSHFVSLAYGSAFLILPIIYWSRIELRKHTWAQLILGTLLGAFIGLASWTI